MSSPAAATPAAARRGRRKGRRSYTSPASHLFVRLQMRNFKPEGKNVSSELNQVLPEKVRADMTNIVSRAVQMVPHGRHTLTPVQLMAAVAEAKARADHLGRVSLIDHKVLLACREFYTNWVNETREASARRAAERREAENAENGGDEVVAEDDDE